MTDKLSDAELAKIASAYIGLFHRQQFQWRAVHQIDMWRELSDNELRDCIDDVCEYLRQTLVYKGRPITREMHDFLKGILTWKLMGPTKQQWGFGRRAR